MKTPFCLVAALTVAGCASGGPVAGVKMSSDTGGLMLTNRPAQEVAQCLATALHSTVQQDASGFAITAVQPAAVYHVQPFADKLHRYNSVVEISGSTELPAGIFPSLCLSAGQQRG